MCSTTIAGLRFSGNNLNPLPGWLAGSQYVALNMSNTDLAVQVHFALFNRTCGFVLKPCEMLPPRPPAVNGCSEEGKEGELSAASPPSPGTGSEVPDHGFGLTAASERTTAIAASAASLQRLDDDDYWPPTRENLMRVTMKILSLHQIPKAREPRQTRSSHPPDSQSAAVHLCTTPSKACDALVAALRGAAPLFR